MKPLSVISSLILALGLFATTAMAGSDYPTKPVTLLVPYGAGGGTDNLTRIFQPAFQKALGGTVVVEDRPGGGSTIGTALVTKAAPDGYTVLVVDTSITVNPALHSNLPYDALRDLEPVSLLATGPVILVGHPSTKASTLSEIIDIAKRKPGVLTFASGGNGAATHLALELMKQVTDIDVIHVPYKGSGPATTDLVGGHVQYMFNGISASKQHILGGTLKAFAVTGEQRNPALPEVATFSELGYPKVDPMTVWGAWVPAGTPKDIIQKLSAAFNQAVNDPTVVKKLNALGYFTFGTSPEDYKTRVKADMKKWAKVVAAANIKID